MLDWIDRVLAAIFLVVPVWLVAWGVYVLVRWTRRWRWAAILPAALILADAGVLFHAGGYGGSAVVCIRYLRVPCHVRDFRLHRASVLRGKLPASRSCKAG
jgi:hypothetical protein